MEVNNELRMTISSSASNRRRVVEGFRLPDDGALTENERGWVELIRAIAGDRDPTPTLPAIQALRAVLTPR